MLAPRPTPKLDDHPSSAVRGCLFDIFTATLHIGGRSSIRNLKTRHAVVTRTHIHGVLSYTSAFLRSRIALPKLKYFLWTPKMYSCLIFRAENIYYNTSRSVLLLCREKILSESLFWRCKKSGCVSGRIHPQSQTGFCLFSDMFRYQRAVYCK